jgi:polyhydroxybutyrate depolymerase
VGANFGFARWLLTIKTTCEEICPSQPPAGRNGRLTWSGLCSGVLDNNSGYIVFEIVVGLALLMNDNSERDSGRCRENPLGGFSEQLGLDSDCRLSSENASTVRELNSRAEPAPSRAGLDGFELVTAPRPGETAQMNVKIDDENRKVFFHLPKGYDPDKPVPLVLVFHGANMPNGGTEIEKWTGFSKSADQNGFAVAYLQAESKHTCFNNGQWLGESKDDLKMTSTVIDNLEKNFAIDKDRVYLTGFSWGGSFVHHAADNPEIASKIAAVAEVSGFMTGREKGKSGSHISEISIHSTADDTVFYDGRVSFGHYMVGLAQQPSPYAFEHYAKLNETDGQVNISEKTAPDGSAYQVKNVANMADGSEVTLVTLSNLKHFWPGGQEAPQSIDATGMIVDFFSRHKRQEK